MTNEALILQKLTEMHQDIASFREQVNTHTAQINSKLEEHTAQVNSKLEDHKAQIKLMIENDVTKRIDSLFDGYMLTHEKQWELERKVGALEKRVEQLEIKAG